MVIQRAFLLHFNLAFANFIIPQELSVRRRTVEGWDICVFALVFYHVMYAVKAG